MVSPLMIARAATLAVALIPVFIAATTPAGADGTLAEATPESGKATTSTTAHAIAMHGEPALGPGFRHLPYVNPDAPKGGRLTIGVNGSFDNLNPFNIRGVRVDQIRTFVFESLMARSADEPFTLYGLLAERIELPDDRSEITFHLNPKARFTDGHPVTATDVLFSYNVLRQDGPPYMRSHYSKIREARIVSKRAIRFVFEPGADREIPLIVALMPILPEHLIDADAFGRSTLEPPVGSGAYTISKVEAGRALTFTRNRDHWARDLPSRRGLFNFDQIRLEYYRSDAALFEAFKSGSVDLRTENDPLLWAEGYRFPAMRDGRAVKLDLATGLPDGMRALVFNTRRDIFADVRVRKALIRLFDFKWVNRSLYSSLYARTQSYFARSDLAATGRPMSKRETQLLEPFMDRIRPDIANGTWRAPDGDGTGRDRTALREALELFQAAGYAIKAGKLVDRETGRQLAFEFLARTKVEERLMLAYRPILARIGIALSIRQVDDAQYWSRLKTFDFDMIRWRWSASLSPGNEQIHRWNSAYAGIEGSQNFAGVKNPAVDAMIEAMLKARTRTDFEAAVRAFDRALLSGHYVIPLFHAPTLWIAHWTRLKRPAQQPLFGMEIHTWWAAEAE